MASSERDLGQGQLAPDEQHDHETGQATLPGKSDRRGNEREQLNRGPYPHARPEVHRWQVERQQCDGQERWVQIGELFLGRKRA